MPRPIHFDLTVDEPERAIKFYKDVFGWKFKKWNEPMNTGWLQPERVRGSTAGCPRGQSGMPKMNTIGVHSVDKFAKKIQDKGGKMLVPKTAIPGVGWFATCQDTEGNIFGIIEENKKAK